MKKRYLTTKSYKKAPDKKIVYEKEGKQETKAWKFPSISRIIPETSLFVSFPKVFLLFLSVFLVLVMSTLIYFVGRTGISYAQALKERETTEKQYQYWLEISRTYPSYRDAYFMLALLSYKLEEEQKTKEYLEVVYRLDPGYKQGQRFAAKVGMEWK